MLSNFLQRQKPENLSEIELERLYEKLLKLEVHIYRRRLSHLKALRKRVSMIHREIDKAYQDAYQTYEIDLHNLAVTVREFQEDIADLRGVSDEIRVRPESLNKSVTTSTSEL